MAEQAIETSQFGLHRFIFAQTDTGDTVSGYRSGIFKTVIVGDSSTGTLAVTDGKGTVLATTSLTSDTVVELGIPFEGTLTFTIGGTVNFTVVLQS